MKSCVATVYNHRGESETTEVDVQPNLKSIHATLLEFSARIALSKDQIRSIRKAAGPDRDGDSVFFDAYRGHRALAVVKRSRNRAQKYEMEFSYQDKGADDLPAVLPRVGHLFKILLPFEEESDFACSISFTFNRSSRAKPIIPLPMKYIEGPNAPFDRIQGLHLVRLDGSGTKWDVFFEAPGEGVLFETVSFHYMSKLDESLPERVLAQAESISQGVVFQELSNADHNR